MNFHFSQNLFFAFLLSRPKVKQRIFPCGERPCQQVFVKRLAYIGVSTDIFGSVLLSYWLFKTEPWVLIGRLTALEFGCRSAVMRTFTISSQLLFRCLSLQCWSLSSESLSSEKSYFLKETFFSGGSVVDNHWQRRPQVVHCISFTKQFLFLMYILNKVYQLLLK